MHFSTAFVSFALLTIARCTDLLFPLYVYPNATAWIPVYDALAANPSLQFYLVVNPDDGPLPSPNSEYVAGITRLRTYPNAHIVGYVPTGFGTLPAATIEADIDQYNTWPAAIRPTGIFFDEAERGEVAGSWDILQAVADYARANGQGEYIVNNVGTWPVPDDRIYGIADQTIVFESSFAAYDAEAARNVEGIAQPGARLSLIYYSLPESQLAAQVSKWARKGYGSVYFTDKAVYSEVPTYLGTFARLLAAA